MKNPKLNLVEFGHTLDRSEMRKLMAGSSSGSCTTSDDCSGSDICCDCGSFSDCRRFNQCNPDSCC